MPVHQNKTLDPSHFVVIKPLAVRPPVGLKLQDWSSGKHGVSEPSREQVFRGNYHRRQQLSQQACRRPYGETGEPLYAESVKAFGSLKRVDEKTRNGWSASDRAISTAILKPTGRSMSPAREDSSTLKNHLGHVRRLMSAVRQGRGYFQLLQKEERELQEAQTMERRRREEKQRTECQPPCYDSDSDSESPLRTAFSAGGSRPIGGSGRRKKLPAGRPFTPLHHSLSSPQLGAVALEPLFRQLCCLNWLLEAVTLNPPGRTGPVSSCWDVTDPGRSRVTVKALNKEKAVEMRWDQFISPPKPRRAPSRGRCSFSGRPLRRVSVFSLASSSATTPTLRSLSSLALGPDEAPPPGGAAGSEEISLQGPGGNKTAVPDHGQKLDTLFQGAANEFPGPKQHGDDLFDSSSPQRQLSAVSQFVKSKSSMLEEARASFQERAQELTLSLNSSLDSRARNRWDSGVLTFRSLCRGGMSTPRSRPVTVTSGSRGVPEAVSRPCEDGVWLTRLIAGLPETALRDRRVGRILEKLRRFADGRSLRIRPPAFLKVLGGLQPWELCSPDLCVAIEMVREHVVQMAEEEYDLWLRSRVTLPDPAWSDPSGEGAR
ncbi:coiled-coil domain-containing protein 60-like isoform X1 [Anguilla rostrata]|uniref:coiled-coil domain-containing protein 60-like isoform X1 n=2 Tax=Anguilla rostrata TaxID=7938 RepID=UPI0030D32BA7